MDYKDYYKILGVTKSATADEIRKVFRKLAVKYHPDKNPGNKSAEEKFKEINEAYEVLKDPVKRKKYNELGENWKHYQDTGGRSEDFNWNQWAERGSRQRSRTYTEEDVFGQSGNFSDFFETLFGQSFGEQGHARWTSTRGEDLHATLELTLEDAFHGGEKLIQMDGKKINLKLKPGLREGQLLRMKGKGGAGRSEGEAGDLLITIKVLKHQEFEQKGNDLYVDNFIDVVTAVLGGKTTIGVFRQNYSITIPPGTDSGKMFRLKGGGMPAYDNPTVRGELYIRIMIKVPKQLSAKEKSLFMELEKIRSDSGIGNPV